MRILIAGLALALAACGGASNGAVDSGETASDTSVNDNLTSPVGVATNEPADEPVADSGQMAEETREPNAPQFEPVFDGQTRAPKPVESEGWALETLVEGLNRPWALAFLPDGSLLVTERSGPLRHVMLDGTISEPIANVPEVHSPDRSQGGLLDIAVAPDFAESRTIFMTFSEPDGDESRTAVGRARLSDDATSLENVEVIFRQSPSYASRGHFGSRIVFHPDGNLFVGLGDRMNAEIRTESQNPMNHIGAVVRIGQDGSVPADNPFADGEGGAPEIWSYGHRNIQAAALHPETNQVWTVEHGPRGGDELNHPQSGGNYGWPTVTHGIEYRGDEIGEGIWEQDGMMPSVYYWDPVLAPSGMIFYTGDAFPAWQGDAFVGGLATRRLSRLVFDGDSVVGEEWLPVGERVRDVAQGPDGAIYVVTDEENGKVIRLVPAEA
ncbi:MAG: PQQ-dependent sugar dehydrogenase [Pseudomonadota bacterium]